MPWASDLSASYVQPMAVGPVMLAIPSFIATPTTVPANGSWSAVIPGDGYKIITMGVTSSQAGNLSIQRYIDQSALVAQGAVNTQALTANTPAVLNVMDGLPYGSFKITITNTSGSVANITGFALLLAAA